MREHLLYIGGSLAARQRRHRPGHQPVDPARRSPRSRWPARRTWTRPSRGRPGRLPGWAALSPFERAAWCERVAAAIAARRDELAHALTQDQGKPLAAEALRRGRRAGRVLPDGRRGRQAPGGRDPAVDVGGPPGAHHPGAARRGRRRQPVELALHDGRGAVRARARGGQRRRLGARPDHHRLLRAAGRDHRRRGHARPGCSASCPGPGRSSGDALVGHPGVGGVGFIGSVATGASGRRPRRGQDPAAGTGRQRPDGDPGGRGPGPGRRRRAGGRLPVRRAELHGGRAVPGPCRRPGRVHRAGGRRDQGPGPARRPVRPADHDGAAEQRADRGQVRPARGRRGRRRGAGVLRRAPGPRVPHHAVRRADRAGRGHPRHGDRPRGDVRPGRPDRRGGLGRPRRWSSPTPRRSA